MGKLCGMGIRDSDAQRLHLHLHAKDVGKIVLCMNRNTDMFNDMTLLFLRITLHHMSRHECEFLNQRMQSQCGMPYSPIGMAWLGERYSPGRLSSILQ